MSFAVFSFLKHTHNHTESVEAGIKLKSSSDGASAKAEDWTSHTVLQAVSGTVVRLPCDVAVSGSGGQSDEYDDSITLILWYRGDRTSVPIYSVDARSVNQLSLAKHHASDSLSSRLAFHIPDHAASPSLAPPSPSSSSSSSSSATVPSNAPAAGRSMKRRKGKTAGAGRERSAWSRQSELQADASSPSSASWSRAFLVMDAVSEQDSGTYVCRVDFKWSRTLTSVTNLTVVGQSMFSPFGRK